MQLTREMEREKSNKSHKNLTQEKFNKCGDTDVKTRM